MTRDSPFQSKTTTGGVAINEVQKLQFPSGSAPTFTVECDGTLPASDSVADMQAAMDKPYPAVRKTPDLYELWTNAAEGAVYVLPRLRKMTNLNPQLGRIIKRPGVQVWPKKWQNLRATRATELEREFPTHVVTSWCGHTERIAKQHYWMTTEEDFKHASNWGHFGDTNGSRGQIGDRLGTVNRRK